jgi:ribosomal protein L37E
MNSMDLTPVPGASVDKAPPTCRCGQDLDHAQPARCSRCGSPSVTHSRVVPLGVAA